MLPYDETGAGDVVVLLHAGVADRTMWREHLDWLAGEGYRAVALDLPGFGEAAVGAGPQAPWNDVLETLKELGVDRASLVGNSFGGAVALRVAVVAPALVEKLVLVSPPPPGLEPSAQLSAVWEAEESALERGDIDAAVAVIVDAWTLPDATDEIRERVAAMQRRALELQMSAAEPEEAPDPLEQHPSLVAELRIPTLVIAGGGDMPDFRTGGEELANALPEGRFELMKQAGHLAPLEAPAAFRELLLGFLRAAD